MPKINLRPSVKRKITFMDEDKSLDDFELFERVIKVDPQIKDQILPLHKANGVFSLSIRHIMRLYLYGGELKIVDPTTGLEKVYKIPRHDILLELSLLKKEESKIDGAKD